MVFRSALDMNGGFESFKSFDLDFDCGCSFFCFVDHSEISAIFDDFLKQSTHLASSTENIQSLYFSQYFSAFSISSALPSHGLISLIFY